MYRSTNYAWWMKCHARSDVRRERRRRLWQGVIVVVVFIVVGVVL